MPPSGALSICAVGKNLVLLSVEMVFRGLYHFSRSLLRGQITDAVTYLVQHHKMLGLIKQERKRHRENAAMEREIWESTA